MKKDKLKKMSLNKDFNTKVDLNKVKGGLGPTYKYSKRTETVVNGYVVYDQGELIVD